MAIPKRLDYAEWDPIPGVSTAGFDHEDDPTWKLLLHTTEGGSYGSARSAYHGNGFSPHTTAGVYKPDLKVVRAWQHVNFDERSTTLGEDPGGIRVGRDYVIQIELIGFADLAYARRFNLEHLYIHNWADWYIEGLAEVCNDILDLLPIPRQCTVTWVDYPESYGKSASQRLTTAQYDAYRGILGHQHAPENCVHPDTPVLRADLEWVRAGDLLVGDDIVGFDEETVGIGNLRGRRYRRGVVTGNQAAKKDCYRVVTSQGEVTATADHPWLVRLPYVSRGSRIAWVKSRDLDPERHRIISLGDPWEAEDTRSAGWMAGVLDADGHAFAGGRHGSWVGFGQVDGPVLDLFLAECDRRGYQTKVIRRDWTRRQSLSGHPKDFTDVRINGGMWASCRVLGTLRPERLLPTAASMWEGAVVGKTTSDVAVLRTESVGIQPIASISTSTRTYVAGGLLCHNTHGDPGDLGWFVHEYLLRLEEDMTPEQDGRLERVETMLEQIAPINLSHRHQIPANTSVLVSRDMQPIRAALAELTGHEIEVDEAAIAQQIAALVIPAILAELPEIPAEQIEQASERAIRRVLGGLDEEEVTP